MKIKPEHHAHIKQAIDNLLRAYPDVPERYASGNFLHADVTKDVQKRFNWDLFRVAVSSRWVCDNLYPYMADPHIDTALRSICPKLTLPRAEGGEL